MRQSIARVALMGLAVLVGWDAVGCVPPAGSDPVANAGPDQVVDAGVIVTLDGSGSYDAQGHPLSFAWAQIGGPTIVLSDPNVADPVFVAPSTSVTLKFQLTVSDGVGGLSSDSVNVRVVAGGGGSPPVANAGPGQTVALGSPVTLDGSGSTDPDGDRLTFAWTQVAGAPVVLNGANTAQATLVAVNGPGTLTFKLTVSDGVLFSSDTVNVAVFTAPVLFVANLADNSVASFANPAALAGNVSASRVLAGPATKIAAPAAVALDAGGRLVVCNSATPSLSIYSDGLNAGGVQAPSAVVLGTNTQLANPVALAVNPTHDLLLVADTSTSRILVFNHASKTAFDGDVAPVRVVASTDVVAPLGMTLTPGDDLYLASATLHRVVVIANASTASGTVAATRIISSTAFVRPVGVFVDSADTLYVADEVTNQVLIFGAASTLRGAAIPISSLRIPGAGALAAVVVDQTGIGYITDRTQNAIYVYENLAVRNGLQPPDRTIQGPATGLRGPQRVFLLD